MVFRPPGMERMRVLWWGGTGLVLASKRLEQGCFARPAVRDGVMRLPAAHFEALFEGLDWRWVEGALFAMTCGVHRAAHGSAAFRGGESGYHGSGRRCTPPLPTYPLAPIDSALADASGARQPPQSFMLVTDLDGTLLDTASRLSSGNRAALESLGEAGVLRVVATGRSLYSADQVLSEDFPIDYLVFSTGVGALRWPERQPLWSCRFRERDLRHAVEVLESADLDYAVHRAPPHNHHFFYRASGAPNPDFVRRRERYRDFARPWHPDRLAGLPASQIIVIEAGEGPSSYPWLVEALGGLSVVRTTSPLDHRSRWTEIFPAEVSKSRAAERIRRRHGVDPGRVSAVGNDYNDTDLLDWAANAYVVANAPHALRAVHAVVASNDDDGFAEVARRVVASRSRSGPA